MVHLFKAPYVFDISDPYHDLTVQYKRLLLSITKIHLTLLEYVKPIKNQTKAKIFEHYKIILSRKKNEFEHIYFLQSSTKIYTFREYIRRGTI